MGTRRTGEAGDFRVEWGFGILLCVNLLSCDLLYCYFVESKKACLVFRAGLHEASREARQVNK